MNSSNSTQKSLDFFLLTTPPPRFFKKQLTIPKKPKMSPSISLRSVQISGLNPTTVIKKNPGNFLIRKPPNVKEKLLCLVSEFRSLSEPIDRVKRLLHYAGLLPEIDDSVRMESNRVTGCTAQVWLEVRMDADGAMRFRADSDSEITKGFCSCLIWLLDGAAADEVLGVKVDDLGEMNVGILPSRASSRINTWHTVLISMQKRTKALISIQEVNHYLQTK